MNCFLEYINQPLDITKDWLAIFDPDKTPRLDCENCGGNVNVCRERHKERAQKNGLYFVEQHLPNDDLKHASQLNFSLEPIDKVRLDLWRVGNSVPKNTPKDHPSHALAQNALRYLSVFDNMVEELSLEKKNNNYLKEEIQLNLNLNFDPNENAEANQLVQEAAQFYIHHIYPYLYAENRPKPTDDDAESFDTINEPADVGAFRLYPNAFDPNENIGLALQFSDRYNAAIKAVKKKENVKHGERTLNFKVGSELGDVMRKDKVIAYKGEPKIINFSLEDPEFQLRTFDAFYERLLKIRDAKVIQVVCGLFDYAAQTGNWNFKDVSLNDFMKLFLKLPKTGYFSQDERRKFSDVLFLLSEMKIELDTDVMHGKKKFLQRNYYRLLDLDVATFATQRGGLPDLSVIVKFNGELLPKFNKGAAPGRLYGKGILGYDANKDRTAVILSFLVQTRLSQINQSASEGEPLKPCSIQRGELIEYCGYEASDKLNSNEANLKLKRTLDKLVERKDIERYSPETIPSDNSAFIWFHPLLNNVKGTVKTDAKRLKKNANLKPKNDDLT